MKHIYLDYAAATPMSPEVIAAMRPFLSDCFYNPSATYLAGRAARQALQEQRSKVARCLGARPAEIIFTAGATEANNLAIQGVLRRWPAARAASMIRRVSRSERSRIAGTPIAATIS